MENNKMIILFDGVCNLCNRSVQFIIRHDKKKAFVFAPLQGKAGETFLRERRIDTAKTDSLVLIVPGMAYYTKAMAVLKIGQAFGGAWKLLALLEWIPPVISNACYDLVARNRYRWFGRREHCMIPTAEMATRFLEGDGPLPDHN